MRCFQLTAALADCIMTPALIQGPFSYSGGGGGGGRIVISYLDSATTNGSITASGGGAGAAEYPPGDGAEGTVVFVNDPQIPLLVNGFAAHPENGMVQLTWSHRFLDRLTKSNGL